jgi:hypothetical protein
VAITVTVEDGTLVTNANSYVSIADVRAYALQRGITLSTDDAVAAQLIVGTDYLEQFECQYQGKRVDCTTPQALAWPRKSVVLCCEDWPEDQIPKNLKSALSTLVIAQHSGVNLFPNIGPADYIIREKVGPLETEYANPLESGISTRITGVDALLAPLFGSCGETGFLLRTIRV